MKGRSSPLTLDKHTSQASFLESLSLLPIAKLKDIPATPAVDASHVIDLTKEEVLPKSPNNFRSQKSLLYSKGRDTSPHHRNIFDAMTVLVDVSDNESISSKSEDIEGEDSGEVRMAKSGSFLTIDLSSPLGERVRKHVHTLHAGYTDTNDRKPYEDYCHTHEDSPDAKLRARHCAFPITYRNRRKCLHDSHIYKFNKSDKRDFEKQKRTGLTKYSRLLKNTMKRCRVRLENLTADRIKELCKPTKRVIDLSHLYAAAVKAGPTSGLWRYLMANNILGGQNTGVPLNTLQQLQRLQQMLLNGGPHSGALQHLLKPAAQPQIYSTPVPVRLHVAAKRPNVIRHSSSHRPEVIDISSSEDEDDGPSRSISFVDNSMSRIPPPIKSHINDAAVMFKCNLCNAEILFTQSTTRYIREHFAHRHGVKNVDILQHRDQDNQLVFSIVEAAAPTKPTTPMARPISPASVKPTRPLSSRKTPSVYRRPPPPHAPSAYRTNAWLATQNPRSATQEVICID